MNKFLVLISFMMIFLLVASLNNDEKRHAESFDDLEKLMESIDADYVDENIVKYREKMKSSIPKGKVTFANEDREKFEQRIKGKLNEMKKKLDDVLSSSLFRNDGEL